MSSLVESNWFVQSNGTAAGPYSLQHLQSLAETGVLTRSSLIKAEEGSNWIRAGQVPMIFGPKLPVTQTVTKEVSSLQSNRESTLPSVTPPKIPTAKMAIGTGRKSGAKMIGLLVSALVASFGCIILLCIVLLTVGDRQVKDSNPKPEVAVAATEVASTVSKPLEPKLVLTTEELVGATSKSVALIRTDTGSGSGFVVETGVIATNYHVIADADSSKIEVTFPDGEVGLTGPFQASLLAELPTRDLAILKIDRSASKLAIDREHKFRRGQEIVVIGSPGIAMLGDVVENAVTPGILSSQAVVDGLNFYQLSVAINGGNSGGPVLGMDGKVIGVASMKSTNEEAIGFCIPAADLVNFLTAHSQGKTGTVQEVEARHQARRVVREILESSSRLSAFIDDFASFLEDREDQISGRDFAEFVGDFLTKNDARLLDDYTHELSSLIKDDHLTTSQRSDLDSLLERHNAIRQKLSSPPDNSVRLTADLNLLYTQLVRQLAKVHRSLDIGPEYEALLSSF